MKLKWKTAGLLVLAGCAVAACTSNDGSGTDETTSTGDGDGDTATATGDGDGDTATATGDGDGDTTTTGATTAGDGDGDTGSGGAMGGAGGEGGSMAMGGASSATGGNDGSGGTQASTLGDYCKTQCETVVSLSCAGNTDQEACETMCQIFTPECEDEWTALIECRSELSASGFQCLTEFNAVELSAEGQDACGNAENDYFDCDDYYYYY